MLARNQLKDRHAIVMRLCRCLLGEQALCLVSPVVLTLWQLQQLIPRTSRGWKMKFSINDDVLRDMFKLGSYVVPESELVFFALRGAQPIEFGGSDFRNSHELLVTPIDYRHMRCTIGQWQTDTGKLAVFVGSSVPHV